MSSIVKDKRHTHKRMVGIQGNRIVEDLGYNCGEHVLLLVNELELHSDVRREIIREIGFGHDKHQVFIMLAVSFFRADGHGLLGACLHTQDGILETRNNLSTPELKLEGLSAGRGIKDLAAFEPSRVMNFYRVA